MNTLKTAWQAQSHTPPPYLTNTIFSHVLKDVADGKYDAEKTLTLLRRFFSHHILNPMDFPLLRQSYTRMLLLKEKTGFEIMMARWDKGAVTPIHGHPFYSFLYVIEGELSERFFIRDNKKLMEVNTLNYKAGDYSYHIGDPKTFDNAIHKVMAVRSSLSLHIYSDDALKGEVFNIP